MAKKKNAATQAASKPVKNNKTTKRNNQGPMQDSSFSSRMAKATDPSTIARTAQDSIPYLRTYEGPEGVGGIIETELGRFTKSYIIADTNFIGEDDERQDEILRMFSKILNTFQHTCSYELTLNTRTTNAKEFAKMATYDFAGDGFDEFRREHNQIIEDKIKEGRNNLRTEIYLTIGISAKSVREAQDLLLPVEKDVSSKIKKINDEGMRPLTLAERLEIIHDICTPGQEGEFAKTFDPQALVMQGLSTKDVVAPASFITKDGNKLQMGDTYAKALYLKAQPANINAGLFRSFSSVSANVVVSIHYMPFEQGKAVSYARNQVTMIGGDVGKSQKNLSKNGMSFELVPQTLRTEYESAQKMLDDLSTNDQRLFNATLVILVMAPSEDELDAAVDQVMSRAREGVCVVETLHSQQEQGFVAALPLARCPVSAKHIMTSECASALQPFSSSEAWSKGGEYYGLNAITKNIIILNRQDALNQNGCILGMSGSGKSFAAKLEMYQAFLSPAKSQIFILDPENEYSVLTRELGGEVIPIMPSSHYHINPMDLNIAEVKDDDGDPYTQKVDFLFSVIELMLGGKSKLSGAAMSMIDSVLKELYAPYLEHLREEGLDIDKEACPTLRDFYDKLATSGNQLANDLAESIKIYCAGSLDLFSHKSNVDLDSKLICYDLSNIGSQLQTLGMEICLQDMWNRMKSNCKKEIRTWLYVDEAHLFLAMPSTAAFLQMVWKRARKWYGSPTFITQNVNDVVSSAAGHSILSNSDFTLMLKQDRFDREELAKIYKISDEMQEYITNSNPGEGLIYTGRTIIPFENHYPTNSRLYKIMSTKPGEEEDEEELEEW